MDKKIEKGSSDVMSAWQLEFTNRIQLESKSRKEQFTFRDACNRPSFHTKRDKTFLSAVDFLDSNPLRNNDYVKYVSYYNITGKKLNAKYFRNDLIKLENYYIKVDEAKAKGETYCPFSVKAYERYVLYMVLKFNGEYTSDLDEAFGVNIVGHREYNPLTNIPSVLRGELPFEIKEYDIYRAFYTFLCLELRIEPDSDIYAIISKKTLAYLLNANHTGTESRESILKKLKPIFGENAEKVCTLERFNEKGKLFNDLIKYEKEYIERCAIENKLVDYVRLHDAIVVRKDAVFHNTEFDIVKFSIKECVKPAIENEIKKFYTIDQNGKVYTSPSLYANFFIQEKFLRISTPDDIPLLLRDTNNVVIFFHHNTNTVSFLKENINEFGVLYDTVADTIARDFLYKIKQGFLLIPPVELIYYQDTKNSFGLPFKNGFFYFDSFLDIEPKRKNYTEVKGFFSPHDIQSREFQYTNEVGMFEHFVTRVAIGQKEAVIQDQKNIVESFCTMIGFMCHNYKNMTKNPCPVLSDMFADDEARNGRRGKTLLLKGIQEVQMALIKGGKEFDSGYTFVFNDLDKKHNVYIIDDVPPGFKYDDLYTAISGDISAQKKGLKAESIKFKDTPKFAVTTNWIVSYDEKNASTNWRFIEYKFTNYYNIDHTPNIEFNCTFFEEWDSEEWNRFYSFVFRCVRLYLQKGIIKTDYNKTNDNYKAKFSSDAILEEFERIMSILIENDSFKVSDFLKLYNDPSNSMRHEKIFTIKNTKKFIDVWMDKFNSERHEFGFEYIQRSRNWIKKQ
ncbi:hypothetical protein [Flavobacterium gilvum]|uniref:Uncharacterized protein n=1 Tax=Flavobacterium gilvum TaxID=1492737 RepID=A0AAC9I7F9_9FLAO|nr:hypothetical protein [Flavobacterium gilvum]AOW10488.1 hypothetical protein EM308_13800 [Flavobacterium gilvum]KFC61132.1 hypothetical protein FEM08_00680 [Flavobacterium gilvum]